MVLAVATAAATAAVAHVASTNLGREGLQRGRIKRLLAQGARVALLRGCEKLLEHQACGSCDRHLPAPHTYIERKREKEREKDGNTKHRSNTTTTATRYKSDKLAVW